MQPNDLEMLIKKPEGEELEFKRWMPFKRHLATSIAAFANTDGGTLLIGVDDKGASVGIKRPEKAQRKLKRALRLISPELSVETETVEIQGKAVLVIRIPKGENPPYRVRGISFERSGDKEIPIRGEHLYSLLTAGVGDRKDVSERLKALCNLVERLNEQLIHESCLTKKIMFLILGGAIATIIRLLVDILIEKLWI
jgi:predicted HTH transcriptional regulator